MVSSSSSSMVARHGIRTACHSTGWHRLAWRQQQHSMAASDPRQHTMAAIAAAPGLYTQHTHLL
jgi:hypothetical protein